MDNFIVPLQILSSIVFGGISAYVLYRKMRNEEAKERATREQSSSQKYKEEQSKFREEIQREVALLRDRNAHLQEKNEQLIREIAELTGKFTALEMNLNLKIALYESAHQDLPLPMWLKDENGKVLALNSAYEKTFLRPIGKTMQDYMGHDDFAVWPKEVAEQFRRNDMLTYSTGETWAGTEDVPDESGTLRPWHIVKYVRWAGPIKLGIAGIAFPMALK